MCINKPETQITFYKNDDNVMKMSQNLRVCELIIIIIIITDIMNFVHLVFGWVDRLNISSVTYIMQIRAVRWSNIWLSYKLLLFFHHFSSINGNIASSARLHWNLMSFHCGFFGVIVAPHSMLSIPATNTRNEKRIHIINMYIRQTDWLTDGS